MRYLLLVLMSAPALFADLKSTMVNLEHDEISKNCKGPCDFKFESATQNEIGLNENMWAFGYVLAKATKIAYFREKDGKFSPIAGQDFHRMALNPKSQVVARYQPAYLHQGGTIAYTIPELWKTEGLSPSSNSMVRLSTSGEISVEVQSLDDAPLKGIEIRRVSAADYEIKAGRNIKTDQPAVKIIVRLKGASDPILQIAIPLKPRPNYFLFGVVGFLFGGLIAVMVLVMRSKPA